MPLIEILELSHSPAAGGSIERGAVESLMTRQLFEGEVLPIEGWVVRRGGVEAVEIDMDGVRVRTVRADGLRPDVREAFPEIPGGERCGFRTTISLVKWGETTISVRAAISPSERIAIASIRARRRWRENPDLAEAPLVSVVVLAGDPASRLSPSIESALTQTYPHLEVVVVRPRPAGKAGDDLSNFPAVRVVENDLDGLTSARNTGIRRTAGDFLLFLDAKERLEPDAIESGLSAFRKHPESAAIFGHRPASAVDGGSSPEAFQGNKIGENAFNPGTRSGGLLPLYRRSVFESVGVFQGGARRSEEDLLRRIASRFPISCHDQRVTERPGSEPRVGPSEAN